MSSKEEHKLPGWLMSKLRWLEYDHLPPGLPRETSMKFNILAYGLVDELTEEGKVPEGFAVDQLMIALQRIIDAKDAAVRAAISKEQDEVHE